MNTLIEVVNRMKAWPEGSNTRKVQIPAIRKLVEQDKERIAEAEDLLNRQWNWLDRHQDDEHYTAREDRFLATLADYEDLCDGVAYAEQAMEAA